MKTKHLFYTLALSSMFAACSQEELVNSAENNAEALAQRPVAGQVGFSLDQIESRYNHQAADFGVGETLDLYLMDEFNGLYDELDANHMHGHANSVECWKYFSVWSDMYSFVNYAQTRYPFAYNGEKWVNDATLLEGNYIAMHPSNEKISNRRDVWQYINPVIDLTNEAGEYNKFAALDNQFWLGYTPIYRNEDRSGEMILPLTMQPIMTVAKLTIVNAGDCDVKIDKIVFKDKFGRALPTIAYVRPDQEEEWRKTAWVGADNVVWDAEGCDSLNCNEWMKEDQIEPNYLNTVYDREKTWPKSTTGLYAARNLVEFDTPADRIPYGLEDTDVAYEYVYNFPEDGYFLEGGVGNNESNVSVYIVLPFDNEYKYEPVVYGRMNDRGNWIEGIIRKGDDDNAFTLNSIDLNKAYYGQEVMVKFEDEGFEALKEARVSTTEDLMKYLKANEPNYNHEGDAIFTIQVYGDDLAITDEVAKYIKDMADAEATDCDLFLDFKAMDRINTPAMVTIDTEMACLDNFRFYNGTIDLVIAKGEHTFNGAYVNVEDLNIEEGATLNLKAVTGNENLFKAMNIENNGTLVIDGYTVEADIENHGEIEFKGVAKQEKQLTNEKKVVVTGTATIKELINKNTCLNCGLDVAILDIDGTLIVEKLTNADYVDNDGTLTTTEEFNNSGTADMDGTATLDGLKNSGTLNVNSGVTEIDGDNTNTINIAAAGEVNVERPNVLNNTGTINVEGDLNENIKNSGYVYVINDGHAIVNGSYNDVDGIIDITAANDASTSYAAMDKTYDNYFRYTVGEETTSVALAEILENRISNENYGINPIILVWGTESASTFTGSKLPEIARIIINNDLTIIKHGGTKKTVFKGLQHECTAVGYVENNGKSITINGNLTIDNDAELEVINQEENGYTFVWVSEGAKLKADNTSAVMGKVLVTGSGVVEVFTTDFSWGKNFNFKGEWEEK